MDNHKRIVRNAGFFLLGLLGISAFAILIEMVSIVLR